MVTLKLMSLPSWFWNSLSISLPTIQIDVEITFNNKLISRCVKQILVIFQDHLHNFYFIFSTLLFVYSNSFPFALDHIKLLHECSQIEARYNSVSKIYDMRDIKSVLRRCSRLVSFKCRSCFLKRANLRFCFSHFFRWNS